MKSRLALFDNALLGTACAVIAAVAYTASNVCLRAVAQYDPAWVSCIKAMTTSSLILPWILWRASKRHRVMPPGLGALYLALGAFMGQIVGNLLFQWSLGIVGLALTVPLTLGSIIIGGAILGPLFLKEKITRSSAIAMSVLLLAIVVLGFGGRQAHASVALQLGESNAAPSNLVLLGVMAASFCGFGYAVLNVIIRHQVSTHTAPSSAMFVVTTAGTFYLGAISWARIGPAAMFGTPLADLGMMFLAGAWNAVAFLAFIRALKLTSVVHVGAINASQSAMAAVAGILFFAEAPSLALVAGVVLTIVGLTMMATRSTQIRRQAAAHLAAASATGMSAEAILEEEAEAEELVSKPSSSGAGLRSTPADPS